MSVPPPKPWERNGSVASVSTASGAPKPWEQAGAAVAASNDPLTSGAGAMPTTALTTRTQPARPWERSGVNNTLGSTSMYGAPSTSYLSRPGNSMSGGGAYGSTYGNSTYGANGMYGGGSMYGTGGGMYGSSMYGNSGMYGSSMYGTGGMNGSSMYGTGGMYGSSMYGAGGMYGRGYGGMYGAGPGMYGMGGAYSAAPGAPGGMYGPGGMGGPFDPAHPPPAPPNAWQAILGAVGGVVHFFGRISFLVDENAHAVHFFVSALLQLLDRAGTLYGEVARFILRVLLRRRSGPLALPAGKGANVMDGPLGPGNGTMMVPRPGPIPQSHVGGPPMLPTASHWDSLWSDS